MIYLRRRPWRGVERKRQHRARRHAGMKLVADQAGQFQDRAALAGGAQKRLVGHALLVKRQHIGHGRGGVEQRDGEIVIGAAAQFLQRRELGARQRRQEALFECAMGADAVSERRQAGPVEQPAGSALSHAGAAAALPQAMQRYQAGLLTCHLRPRDRKHHARGNYDRCRSGRFPNGPFPACPRPAACCRAGLGVEICRPAPRSRPARPAPRRSKGSNKPSVRK